MLALRRQYMCIDWPVTNDCIRIWLQYVPCEGQPAFERRPVLCTCAVHAQMVHGQYRHIVHSEAGEMLDHGYEGILVVPVHVICHLRGK